MKRIIIIAALLLTFVSSFAQTGKSIYRKYSDFDGVSAVYISPAMFRMIGRIPDMEVEGTPYNLGSIIQTLNGLYLLSSENPSISGQIKAEVDQLLDNGQYELMMESKDSGETVRMYTTGTDSIVTGFIMFALERNETTFICLEGKMNRKDLEDIFAEQMH